MTPYSFGLAPLVFPFFFTILQEHQPETVRVEVDLVHVLATVRDSKGRPVTDLRAGDFTVLEDGVPQSITHFRNDCSQGSLVASDEYSRSAAIAALSEELSEWPPSRTVLILFGRGVHSRHFGGTSTVLSFIRNGLRTTDAVAVIAYGFATEITIDHDSIARSVERYAQANEQIESLLRQGRNETASLFRSWQRPESASRIEELLGFDRRIFSRNFLGSADAKATADRRRADSETVDSAIEINFGQSDRAAGAQPKSDFAKLRLSHTRDLPDYFARRGSTEQDIANLYAALEYLRYVRGQKHVVFLTDEGLFLPGLRNPTVPVDLARVANDAGVRIHAIQTGGLPVRPHPTFDASVKGRNASHVPVVAPPDDLSEGRAGSFTLTFALASTRELTEQTGGEFLPRTTVEGGLRAIFGTQNCTYILGYRPQNRNFNGAYRKITVRTKREHLEVRARNGYFAETILAPGDQEKFTTYARITEALNYQPSLNGVEFNIEAITFETLAPTRSAIDIDLRITPEGSMFDMSGEIWTGKLALSYFVLDGPDVVTEAWDELRVKLDRPAYDRAFADGIRVRTRVEVRRLLRKGSIKIIIYDPKSQRLGTLVRPLSQK